MRAAPVALVAVLALGCAGRADGSPLLPRFAGVALQSKADIDAVRWRYRHGYFWGGCGVATTSIATLPTPSRLDRIWTSKPPRGVGIAATTVGTTGPAPVLFEMRPTPRVLLSPGPPHQLQDGPTVAVVADGWIHLRLAEGRTRCMARHTSGRNRSMIG